MLPSLSSEIAFGCGKERASAREGECPPLLAVLMKGRRVFVDVRCLSCVGNAGRGEKKGIRVSLSPTPQEGQAGRRRGRRDAAGGKGVAKCCCCMCKRERERETERERERVYQDPF